MPPSRHYVRASRVPEPAASPADSELRAHVERALTAHYELDREIGRGGMGIVYRGRDRRLKRTVAIKILPPELAFRSEIKTRFLREAETAAQLSHPNIVPIYTVDEADGLVYFVMAYVSGDNLAKRLHERGVLTVDETRRILRDVADALAYAHERGVVHRDIKPDNILLDDESGRPMVTDFGIARAVSDGDSRLTATGMAIGTPAYMSPEQAAGEREIDGRSDLYSLGILGYQMLAGEPPFSAGSTPAMLVKHISERPVPIEQRRADVPDDLARAVMMLLEKDPANRFPSAGALVTAIDSGQVPPPRASREGTQPSLGMPSAASGPLAGASASALRVASPYPGLTSDELALGQADQPTADELRRWEAEPVQRFRKKLAPYLFVNAVIVIASVFGRSDFFGVTVIWSIYMAFKYAKLWADGYDWRDVFRQSRDRELIDVVDELLTTVRSLFDRQARERLREQRRARRVARRSGSMALPGAGRSGDAALTASAMAASGPHSARIRQAAMDRDEILRMVDSMNPDDRARIPDVSRSAVALFERVQSLAISLADLDRNVPSGGLDAIESEIQRLENAANPLERAASEDRVRRLAYLKRQRRSVNDVAGRRDTIAGKLETCALALQNMKLDVLRLRAGAQTHQQITSLAMNALDLAQNVDSALYVADEMGRVTNRGGRPSAGSPGRTR